MLEKETFREYDIRGIYNVTLNDETGYLVGKSYGSKALEMGAKEVIVGYDNRLSSPSIHKKMIQGLLETGINIIDLGLVTTPMLYFARKHLNNPFGIMITASHNPKEYNGFKFSFTSIGNAYGKDIENFYEYTKKGDFKTGNGTLKQINIEDDYANYIIKSLNLGNKKIKAVFDPGNGTGSIIIKKIISKLPIEAVYINDISDGNFPNHHPDPSVRTNMKMLEDKVSELGFDIGVALDGDADRVGIVDKNGQTISIDIVMAMVYKYLNNNLKYRNALFDVKCSRTLIDELKKLKIKPIMYRTGASYTNMMMQTGEFDFGGEYSGHLFFKDKFYGFDDGLYAGLRMIEILSNGISFEELRSDFNKYYSTDEMFIEVKEENKKNILNKIKEYVDEQNYKYEDIDGIRVEFENGFALIRSSNTTPRLSLRFEAKSLEELEEIKNEFMNLLEVVKWKNLLMSLKHSYQEETF